MAVRKCPQCLAVVPASETLAYSNSIECPGCKARLQVTDGSRHVATLAGLLAGVLAWRLTGHGEGTFSWVLPVLYSVLAFGIVGPLALAFIADLRLKPEASPEEPLAAQSSGHGGHH